MATIRQRSPGVWEVRVYAGRDEQGRPAQVSRIIRGSRRAAERAAANLAVAEPSAGGAHTVAQLLEMWQDLNRDGWTPRTTIDQGSRARLIAAGRLGRRRVGSVKVEDIDRWIIGMRAEGVGRSSIYNRLKVLRAALAQAVKWGWINHNPAAQVSVRGRTDDRPVMSDDEVLAVIAAAPHMPAAIMLRLAAATGARRSELAALRLADLTGARLTIAGQITVLQRGTRQSPRPPVLERRPTKTGRIRSLTLDDGTLGLIEKWRQERDGLGPWLLSVGDDPPSPDTLSWWWRHARDAAGIDRKWRLHDLRHWSATTAIIAGTDVRTVANRLGHSNPAMTLRVYAHAIAAADAGAAAALGRVLGGPQRD